MLWMWRSLPHQWSRLWFQPYWAARSAPRQSKKVRKSLIYCFTTCRIGWCREKGFQPFLWFCSPNASLHSLKFWRTSVFSGCLTDCLRHMVCKWGESRSYTNSINRVICSGVSHSQQSLTKGSHYLIFLSPCCKCSLRVHVLSLFWLQVIYENSCFWWSQLPVIKFFWQPDLICLLLCIY